jgi:hypothetical protein
MKKYGFLLLILFFINAAYAVEVHCGSRYVNNGVFTGDYIFVNTDNFTVRVYIDNRFSLIDIYPSNTFYLEPGESKIISFRAYTAIYDALPVMYTDTINGFTASLVCRYYAMPEGSYIPFLTTTPTTTTVVNYNYDCRNKGFYNCVSLPGCTWVGSLFNGYCKSLYDEKNNETTTTTTIPNTTTTIATTTTMQLTTTTPASTTTIADTCKLLNFWQCQSNSACKWSGDFRFGKCVQNSQYTTTTSTTTTTTTTTTTSTTTTTVCSTVCTRWLRLVCLEWKTVCVL